MCKANYRSLTVAARFEAPLLEYPLRKISNKQSPRRNRRGHVDSAHGTPLSPSEQR